MSELSTKREEDYTGDALRFLWRFRLPLLALFALTQLIDYGWKNNEAEFRRIPILKEFAPVRYGVTDWVMGQNWRFRVDSATRTDTAGDGSVHPQGLWLVVNLTVENIGKANFGIGSSDFAVVDSRGVTYSANGFMSYAVGDRVGRSLGSLNSYPPGLPFRTALVFDINPNSESLSLVLQQAYDLRVQLDAGIGVVIETTGATEYPKVGSVFPDSPAEKVGVKTGDRIKRVDGADVIGLSADDVARRIRGTYGTAVSLVVVRGNQELSFSIARTATTATKK